MDALGDDHYFLDRRNKRAVSLPARTNHTCNATDYTRFFLATNFSCKSVVLLVVGYEYVAVGSSLKKRR